jgi:hypothetical protein
MMGAIVVELDEAWSDLTPRPPSLSGKGVPLVHEEL